MRGTVRLSYWRPIPIRRVRGVRAIRASVVGKMDRIQVLERLNRCNGWASRHSPAVPDKCKPCRPRRTEPTWGRARGSFASVEDGDTFEPELAYILMHQMAACTARSSSPASDRASTGRRSATPARVDPVPERQQLRAPDRRLGPRFWVGDTDRLGGPAIGTRGAPRKDPHRNPRGYSRPLEHGLRFSPGAFQRRVERSSRRRPGLRPS